MTIKQLDEHIINQIAAGEVIERPASVIKELLENAIDAGATQIDVVTAGGGKTMCRVTDNGTGIPTEELILAASKNCTSKIDRDIHNIHTLGFRGEALPSIGSVARLCLQSRTLNAKTGAEILVSGGRIEGPRPAALNPGTVVEVRDLFYATPARLKFLRSDQAELAAITDNVKRTAIAFPHITFSLAGNDRSPKRFPATTNDEQGLLHRITSLFGPEFSQNSIPIEAERENVRLHGYIGIPSYSRANGLHQFFYVNRRPIRDKLVLGAIRAAYADAMARGRYPVLVLFINLEPNLVDVNVHPAKADVRFRDPGLIRGLIVGAVKRTLLDSGLISSSKDAQDMTRAFSIPPMDINSQQQAGIFQNIKGKADFFPEQPEKPWSKENSYLLNAPFEDIPFSDKNTIPNLMEEISQPTADSRAHGFEDDSKNGDFPLGAARAQVHANYIISQTKDSLIIVDQHAAHERLVYEALKTALHSQSIPTQMLLLPEIVECCDDDIQGLMEHSETLKQLGLNIENFGPGSLIVRETPALLGEVNVQKLVRDLIDEIIEHDCTNGLESILHHVAATMACYGSVRSGRLLKPEEMNALLRKMEKTPGSGTCNHGRPTYIELRLSDIEKLFGRR